MHNLFDELKQTVFDAFSQDSSSLTTRLRNDPTLLFTAAGMEPDEWQKKLLLSDSNRILMLCGRQVGKSITAAALALKTALLEPDSLTLLLSPSLRQSSEAFQHKVMPLYRDLGSPYKFKHTQLSLELSNGSRILALPGSSEDTIRGYSAVNTLILDESAMIDDMLWISVSPMVIISKGKIICLSTPRGKRGFFHDLWHSQEAWTRVRIPASECKRIDPEELERQRQALGERFFNQEYECAWSELVGAVFSYADIMSIKLGDVKPLFANSTLYA